MFEKKKCNSLSLLTEHLRILDYTRQRGDMTSEKLMKKMSALKIKYFPRLHNFVTLNVSNYNTHNY